MKKIKIMISILIILILLVSIGLVILKIQVKKDRAENFENTITMQIDPKVKIVSDKNEFFAINACITKYLMNSMLEENEILYSLLDETYIKELGVTKENILEKINTIENPVFYSNKMYVKQEDYDLYTYFVNGRLINKETLEVQDYSVIVRLDKRNDLFSVIPNEYIQLKKITTQDKEKIVFSNSSPIENKQYNLFEFENIEDQTVLVEYINEIKDNMIYDIESSYKKLDTNYRESNFSTIDEYKRYLNENITRFYTMKLTKYKITQYDEYKQYVCIDENDRFCIINEYSIGDYQVMLDEYSVNIPETVQAYKSKSDKEKAVFNVQKFIRSINDSNYKLAYSFLSDAFKQNYFKTQEKFEIYAKQNLKDKNMTNYTIANEGNLYIITITIQEENYPLQTEKFAVSLKEDMKFEMSFNIN